MGKIMLTKFLGRYIDIYWYIRAYIDIYWLFVYWARMLYYFTVIRVLYDFRSHTAHTGPSLAIIPGCIFVNRLRVISFINLQKLYGNIFTFFFFNCVMLSLILEELGKPRLKEFSSAIETQRETEIREKDPEANVGPGNTRLDQKWSHNPHSREFRAFILREFHYIVFILIHRALRDYRRDGRRNGTMIYDLLRDISRRR